MPLHHAVSDTFAAYATAPVDDPTGRDDTSQPWLGGGRAATRKPARPSLNTRLRPSSILLSAAVGTALFLIILFSGKPATDNRVSDHSKVFLGSNTRMPAQVVQQTAGAAKEAGYTRFVCLSDTHGIHSDSRLLQVPDGDVLVFAGDAGLGSVAQVPAFNKFMAALPHKTKVVTFGNMDHWAESAKYDRDDLDAADEVFLGSSSATTVHVEVGAGGEDKEVAAPEFRMAGSPYTPKFYGNFQLQSDDEAKAHWATVLPPDTPVDILVTHGPPHGFGDVSKGRHVGDKDLLAAVQALQSPPVLWVVGHIHAGYGVHRITHNDTGQEIVLANVATNDLRAGADTLPMVFDVKLDSR